MESIDNLKGCYAERLGGCNHISGEHYITKSMLSEFVDISVQLSDKQFINNKIHRNQLTEENLCVFHNNFLSKYDRAAKNLIRSLDQYVDPNQKPPQFINGNHLERWFLKSSINLLFLSKSSEILIDMDKCLSLLFLKHEFPENFGLYIQHKDEPTNPVSSEMMWYPVVSNNILCGIILHLRNIKFLTLFPFVSIDEAKKEVEKLAANHIHNQPIIRFPLIYRPGQFSLMGYSTTIRYYSL